MDLDLEALLARSRGSLSNLLAGILWPWDTRWNSSTKYLLLYSRRPCEYESQVRINGLTNLSQIAAEPLRGRCMQLYSYIYTIQPQRSVPGGLSSKFAWKSQHTQSCAVGKKGTKAGRVYYIKVITHKNSTLHTPSRYVTVYSRYDREIQIVLLETSFSRHSK